jgi:hypothetical protein
LKNLDFKLLEISGIRYYASFSSSFTSSMNLSRSSWGLRQPRTGDFADPPPRDFTVFSTPRSFMPNIDTSQAARKIPPHIEFSEVRLSGNEAVRHDVARPGGIFGDRQGKSHE